jgi:hypothetical protein
MANQTGNDWETELVNYSSAQPLEYDPKTGTYRRRAMGAGSFAEKQKISVRYTNPDDLVRVANETAEKRLGRRFNESEIKNFVSSYQATERASQTAGQMAQEAGGAYTEAPTAETAALKAAEQADPVAYATRGALPLVDSINEMLNGLNFGQTRPMGG